MTGEYIVAEIEEHQVIEGADKIVQVNKFGEVLIVDKVSNPVGTRGIVIDCLSVLDKELVSHLNMFRHGNLNADPGKSGLMEDNARVRPIRLRGVKCSGLFISFTQLSLHPDITSKDLLNLKIGAQSNKIGDVEICKQFFRKVKGGNLGGKQAKAKENLVPTFMEHIDTDQLARNPNKVKRGDYVVITEKQHGTSGRFGYLPVLPTKTLFSKFFGLFGYQKPVHYGHVVGSRRVTKSIDATPREGVKSFYDEDIWTQSAYKHFTDKLKKGETVYYEIVGYLPDGGLIMPTCSNKKLKPFMEKKEYKEFIEKFGDETTFTYGCKPKEYKVFVYRITLTNDDGHAVDYPWEVVKGRCEQMDVPHVPELTKFVMGDEIVDDRDLSDDFLHDCANWASEDSKDFPAHLREGVCVRIDNGFTPTILKEKSYNFKVLEGIIKETQDTLED